MSIKYYVKGRCIEPREDLTTDSVLRGEDAIGPATNSEQANLSLKGLPLRREHVKGDFGRVLYSKTKPGKGHYFIGVIDKFHGNKKNLKSYQMIEQIERGNVIGISTKHRGLVNHDTEENRLNVKKIFDEITITFNPNFPGCGLDLMVSAENLHRWLGTDDESKIAEYLMENDQMKTIYTSDDFSTWCDNNASEQEKIISSDTEKTSPLQNDKEQSPLNISQFHSQEKSGEKTRGVFFFFFLIQVHLFPFFAYLFFLENVFFSKRANDEWKFYMSNTF